MIVELFHSRSESIKATVATGNRQLIGNITVENVAVIGALICIRQFIDMQAGGKCVCVCVCVGVCVMNDLVKRIG